MLAKCLKQKHIYSIFLVLVLQSTALKILLSGITSMQALKGIKCGDEVCSGEAGT